MEKVLPVTGVYDQIYFAFLQGFPFWFHFNEVAKQVPWSIFKQYLTAEDAGPKYHSLIGCVTFPSSQGHEGSSRIKSDNFRFYNYKQKF